MKVDGRYYCFGCHETGSVIDLTAKLFALTPLNAARKLAADFHLDPEAPVPALPPAVQAQHRQRDDEARCIRAMTAYEQLLRQKQRQYAPAAADGDFDPRSIEVCRKLPAVSHCIDLLYDADPQTRRDTAQVLIRSGAVDRVEGELRTA